MTGILKKTINTPVLVLGATGETGWRTVRALRLRRIPVRGLVRSPEKAAAVSELNQPGVELLIGDVSNDADLRLAVTGVKHVISATGRRPNDGPEAVEAVEHLAYVRLVAAALEEGIEQIVMCSSLGTETPELVPPLAAILQAKRRGELALINSGLPYTIVRPGGLVNEPGGQDVLAKRHLMGFGRITRDDVAEVLVQALLQPAARNKIAEIINQPGAGPANRSDLFSNLD